LFSLYLYDFIDLMSKQNNISARVVTACDHGASEMGPPSVVVVVVGTVVVSAGVLHTP